MKLQKLNNFSIHNQSELSFKRAPSDEIKREPDATMTEEQEYPTVIKEAKDYLGIRNLALIMHGSSFPVAKNDLFIGSPINNKAKEVNDFLKMHGFDSIQLGPPGLLQRDDFSPYLSSIHSRNYLFTDMEQLTKPNYGKLLKLKDIQEFTNPDYIKNSNTTMFESAFNAYDKLFERAYDNMNSLVKSNDAEATDLFIDFNLFKEEQDGRLDADAMFEVLAEVNGNDDYEKWSDLDKNLVTYLNDEHSPMHDKAKLYEASINDDFGKEIDLYKFKQFIVKKQEAEFASKKDKLNYMSDAIIGFSPRDVWANQDKFLKNYRVGCPYGGEGEPISYSSWGANQVWDIPLVDPKTLFNSDGSIGKGGQLIQEKFRALLENHQSIRIDHVLGLVDPWVYDKTRLNIEKDEKGNVIHTTAYGSNISMFGKPNAYDIKGDWNEQEQWRRVNADIEKMPNIDPDGNYKRLIHEILLPVFKEKGLKTSDAAWENLGSPTEVFNEVCYGYGGKRSEGDDREIIPGMSSLKSYRGEQEAKGVPYNTFLIQSHDDDHAGHLMTNKFYIGNQDKERGVMNPLYLIGSLYPDYSQDEKAPLFNKLEHDVDFRTLTKFQELMRFGKNIQVTFMDFFGLGERYNYSGTTNPKNWKLRMPQDYKDNYYKTLERSKHDDGKDPEWWRHIAMNMPELLKRAVISKAVNDGKSTESVKDLTDKLNYYEEILKESK